MIYLGCGDVYVWGKNDTGCLGLGHLQDQMFPFKVIFNILLHCVSDIIL